MGLRYSSLEMNSEFKILYVEDEHDFRETVLQVLGVYNDVEGAADYDEALALIRKNQYDVVILDKVLGTKNGLDLIPEVKLESPKAVVVILTGDSDFNSVKKCIGAGADDYVVKSGNIVPDLLVRIPVAVARAASERQLTALQEQLKQALRFELVGKSQANSELRATVLSCKGFNSNVLITGESGTGKELVARMLNAIENDRSRPFEAVNCAAIPENLVESILFGHRKGAFTGADSDRPGKFELANGGDLFLDEIAELSLEAQAKLLRALQLGEFHRVGGEKLVRVSCRVIAATNQNLDDLIKKGKFRRDLYYRLNVIRIRTPPLKERPEDIPDLAQFLVVRHGGAKVSIAQNSVRRLQQHNWPGNIRELSNTIERALISVSRRKGTQITLEDISIDSGFSTEGDELARLQALVPHSLQDLNHEAYLEFIDVAESEYLRRALSLTNGNATEMAQAIGLARTTIFRKIHELGVRRPETESSSTGRSVSKSTEYGQLGSLNQ